MIPCEMSWHVLHVRPRCEKKVAEYCSLHRIEHYLPLREETKVYQRRKVTVNKPVFPGYVFVVFAEQDRVLVLKSNQIVRILDVLDQERLIHELDQIRLALQVDKTLGACAMFEKGRRVRILSGPFQGLEGVVETVRGKTRVLLTIEMIGQAIALDVGTEMLEPAE